MEFDKRRFLQALLDAPEEKPFLEPPEHSEYLQKQVFDKLIAGEPLKWLDLDWDAFDLRHVTLESYAHPYERLHCGWLQGVNHLLHDVPAARVNEKRFF